MNSSQYIVINRYNSALIPGTEMRTLNSNCAPMAIFLRGESNPLHDVVTVNIYHDYMNYLETLCFHGTVAYLNE